MKNSKLPYYLKNAASLIVPAVLCRISLRNILKTVENYDPLYINERVKTFHFCEGYGFIQREKKYSCMEG
jgi:hypothetical protein